MSRTNPASTSPDTQVRAQLWDSELLGEEETGPCSREMTDRSSGCWKAMPSPMLESCVQHRIPHPVTHFRVWHAAPSNPGTQATCPLPQDARNHAAAAGERTEEARRRATGAEQQPRRQRQSRAPPGFSESTGEAGPRREGGKDKPRGLLTRRPDAKQADREEVGLQHGRPFLSQSEKLTTPQHELQRQKNRYLKKFSKWQRTIQFHEKCSICLQKKKTKGCTRNKMQLRTQLDFSLNDIYTVKIKWTLMFDVIKIVS